MRYSDIDIFEVVNGKDVGVSLYTQGCDKHCKGCFNESTWDFNSGKEYTKETENFIINSCNRDGINRLTILGGEPLLERNKQDLINLCKSIKESKPSINIWLYTGNLFENVLDDYLELFKLIDICIDGPFILEQKDLTLQFRGSSNQRIINVQESIKNKETVIQKYI